MSKRSKIGTVLFNGYILNPGNIVTVFAVVALFCMVMAITVTIWGITDSKVPEIQETAYINASDISFESGQILIYLPVLNQTVTISNEWIEYDKLVQSCRQNNAIAITYSLGGSKKDILQVWSLYDSNNVFMTIDEAHDRRIHNAIISISIVWALNVLYWVFIAFSCMILSHAPKHPFISKLLIRKEYRNW